VGHQGARVDIIQRGPDEERKASMARNRMGRVARRPATLAGRERRIPLFVTSRRQVLLPVDPAVHDALTRWANDEFRSVTAHVEMLLRRALADAGRLPKHAAPLPKRSGPRTADG
jgi:hypothetical protein